MPVATRMIRGLLRRVVTRLMDRVGGRLVTRMADTSSDAPSATYEPKRNLYEKMQKEQQAD